MFYCLEIIKIKFYLFTVMVHGVVAQQDNLLKFWYLVYSAQHISFNLLALENHTLLLGLNVFFSFLYYIQYCRFLVLLLSQFTATKPQEVHLCETFLPLKTFSDIFFWISLNHFLYFAYIIEIFNQIL